MRRLRNRRCRNCPHLVWQRQDQVWSHYGGTVACPSVYPRATFAEPGDIDGPEEAPVAHQDKLFDGSGPSAQAKRPDPSPARSQRVILALLEIHPDGLTDSELAALCAMVGLKISGPGARVQRDKLVEQGVVADSGLRRRTATGRKTIVWKAAQ